MELTREQIDELRMGALTAVDGLWFLEMEKRYGFDTALLVDLEVWRQYGLLFYKRLLRTAGIAPAPEKGPGWDLVRFFLSSLCRVDGTEFEVGETTGETFRFDVLRCPWRDNMKKAGREELIPCERIDDTIFGSVLRVIDPSLSMTIARSFPRGDKRCSFVIRR